MHTAGGINAVTPSEGATTRDGGLNDVLIFRTDGKVQYIKRIAAYESVHTRGGVGCSVDRPSVGDAGVDGIVNVNGSIVLCIHSQRHH